MAEAATAAAAATAAPAAEGAPVAGKKTGLMVGLTVGGAILGGLVASFVIAPRVIARQGHAAVAASTAESGSEEGGEHGGKPAGERKLVELSNIIVNPAGSQGSRFLMTTVAFSVADEKAYTVLKDHEVEVRDRVTSILESRTMAQLTGPGARDSVKLAIATMAGTLIGPKVSVQVYLPQFVIQ